MGIDLSRPLDEATFAWIGRAFAEHPVLVFRDQNVGAAELAAFGRQFGSPRMHALVKYRHAEYPEVSWLTNVEDDGKVDWYGVKRATDWHTDSTYEVEPPILAILHAKEIPSSKGGTMFADMRAADHALPRTMKIGSPPWWACTAEAQDPAVRNFMAMRKEKTEKVYHEMQRPAVIEHPVSRRPILFVNPMHTHGFVGMTRRKPGR